MKKYLASVVCLLLVCALVTIKHQEHSATWYQHLVAVVPDDLQEALIHDPKWYSPSGSVAWTLFGWPNGITVWALLLTMIVIAEQTNETRKSAKASLLNVQALVNVERPWIVVSAESYGYWRFKIVAKNQEKSPAEIVGIAFDWKIEKGGANREVEPSYKIRKAMNPRMLFPEQVPYIVGACNIGDIYSADIDHKKYPPVDDGLFMMYGKVLYYDLLNRVDPPHETRFCFYWSSNEPQNVDDRDSPDSYTGYS